MKILSNIVNMLMPKSDPSVRIEYKNVSDWVQNKIEEKLASGRR